MIIASCQCSFISITIYLRKRDEKNTTLSYIKLNLFSPEKTNHNSQKLTTITQYH